MKGYNCSSTLYEIPDQVKSKARREKKTQQEWVNFGDNHYILKSSWKKKQHFIDYKGIEHSDYPNIWT